MIEDPSVAIQYVPFVRVLNERKNICHHIFFFIVVIINMSSETWNFSEYENYVCYNITYHEKNEADRHKRYSK